MPQALIDATASFKKEEYMSEIMTGPVIRHMTKTIGPLTVGKTYS